ncbi:MAG: PqqD family protein [Oscillospiraceae bacterium]|nr:PqqD family protein [Oscillospiraceae bacterium]
MKRYKAREGLVLTQVCGERLLVSAGALKELCPFVTVLNETSAFLWEKLKNGATAEELEQAVAGEYEVDDPASVRGFIEDFLRQMQELNYLLTQEQGDEHEK